MTWRPGPVWACLAFDIDGALCERSIRSGAPRFIVDEIVVDADARASSSPRFELGGLVIAQPAFMSPDEVSRAVRDALALRLPRNFADMLPDNIIAQLWARAGGARHPPL